MGSEAHPADAARLDIQPADAGRWAILNGFGRTLGDSLIGLTALAAARAHLPPDPVLFRLPGLAPVQQALYHTAGAAVRDLPWEAALPGRPFAPSAGFARVIELRDFAYDAAFARTSMVDFFLARLGLDPAAVPPAAKRNTWLAERLRPAPPRGLAPGYTLVCPNAAGALRQMPAEIHDAMLTRLADEGPVATQGEVPAALAHRVHALGPAATLAELCGQVAAARRVVSTDTAMVHLADAFSVPCLAVFPTHDPAWRVRDYPHCVPVALAADLPRGLEFPRGPADLAAARAAWFAIPLPALLRSTGAG